MQPAQQPNALPAAFRSSDQFQEAQHAHQGAGQACASQSSPDAYHQVNIASASAERQHQHQHQQQQAKSSRQLFQQPGHEVVCIVWEDSASQQHDVDDQHAARHAVPAAPAGHAGPDSVGQSRDVGGGLEQEHKFGDMCRRLGAVIEVSYCSSYNLHAAANVYDSLVSNGVG